VKPVCLTLLVFDPRVDKFACGIAKIPTTFDVDASGSVTPELDLKTTQSDLVEPSLPT
jgi:hypothetical protein